MKKKIYRIPYLGFYTRAYVIGDLTKRTPLIILHGGPGGCVERYEPLEELAKLGIPLIFYDQLGCGYSRVPKGNENIWTFETYLNELENVILFFNLKTFNILGHSWGGMLALQWVTTRQHKGLDKLILFSTLPSTKIWNDEHLLMIKDYPENVQKVLKNNDVNSNDYKIGIKRFYAEHVSKKSDKKYLFKTKRFPKTNQEIYRKMWGDSELFGTGTLKNYDVISDLKNINIPTLIISGKFDESTIKMNQLMNHEIKNSKWLLLEKSHHIGYAEEPQLVINEISKFLGE